MASRPIATLAALALALTCAAADVSPASPRAGSAIVGGGPANAAGWGFAVALQQHRRFHCTGSLIAPTKVLTAAHCAKRAKLKRLRVLAASPWIEGKRRGEAIGVKRILVHPGYNGRKDFRDLAVLTLDTPTSVPAIALASPAQDRAATRPGRLVRSAGWGARSAWGLRIAPRLKSTRERVFSAHRCVKAYGKRGFDPTSMICALGKRIARLPGRSRYRTTSCSGDSGGPLVASTPAGPRLIGVVSAGPLPCGVGPPSIYARVATSIKFIRVAAGQARPQVARGGERLFAHLPSCDCGEESD